MNLRRLGLHKIGPDSIFIDLQLALCDANHMDLGSEMQRGCQRESAFKWKKRRRGGFASP
jgi:hypothetical protein